MKESFTSKQKSPKTQVLRILDKLKIPYEVASYSVDESDLSAVYVAEKLNQNIKQLFKTLVLKGDKSGYFVCVIPGDEELNLKKISSITYNKKSDLVPMKDLLGLTGYIRGACSPIGMKKKFPTYFDSSCLNFAFIYISAGQRGLQVKIDPKNLINNKLLGDFKLLPVENY